MQSQPVRAVESWPNHIYCPSSSFTARWAHFIHCAWGPTPMRLQPLFDLGGLDLQRELLVEAFCAAVAYGEGSAASGQRSAGRPDHPNPEHRRDLVAVGRFEPDRDLLLA